MASTIAVLAVALFVPHTASADAPDFEQLLEEAGPEQTPDADSPLPESTTRQVNLDVQWRLWRQAVLDGNPAPSQLETLRTEAISFGLPSLPHHHLAVLHTTQRAEHYDLDPTDTPAMLQEAHLLAPHLPYAQFERARWHITEDPASAYNAAEPYARGVVLAYEWLDTRTQWGLKLAMWLLMALGIGLFGFLVAQLLRYFGIAAYDGTRFLPRGFSSTQTVIVLVAIVLVPGLLLQSPLLSMVLLLGLLIPFQQLNERLVACLFFAALAALPWANEQIGDLIEYPGSDAQRILHAHYHGCDDSCLQWLETVADDPRGVARLVERTDRLRTGERDEINELRDWFDERDPIDPSEPLAAHWLNLRGTVLIAAGQTEAAVDALEAATDADSESAAPWFNIARAHQLLGEDNESHRAMRRAFNRDLEGVAQQAELTRRDPNSFLMIEPVAGDEIWRAYPPTADADSPAVLEPAWRVVAGDNVELSWALWMGLAGIAFVLLTLPLYLSRRLSSPCPKCGLARDPRDSEDLAHHHYCRPCYQTFVSGASMGYHARVYTEAMLGRRSRLQSFLRRGLSALTPGLGHVLGGHAIRGTLAFGAVLFGAVILLFPQGPFGVWRGALELFRPHWGGQFVIAWLLISVGASVGFTGLLRGIRPTRPRRPSGDDGGPR